jgi:murein DD-endopeptidase MepM/ murein hydrolase activator NlpD
VGVATAAAMPDMKVSDPTSLGSITGNTNLASARQSVVDRANRSTDRGFTQATTTDTSSVDLWLLPMHKYTIAKPYGDSSTMSQGVELQAPEGTPFYAAHSGVVTLARWNAGYGYAVVINVGNGVEIVYGHASKLLVKEGQKVASGDLVGLVGNSGFSWGPNVHFEVRVNGETTNPLTYLSDFNVNLTAHTDSLS